MIKVDAEFLDIDMGYDLLADALKRTGTATSVAGLVRGKTPKDVIEYGAQNYFGDAAAGIPARPFLTQAWDAGAEREYGMILEASLEQWVLRPGSETIEDIFEQVAIIAAGDIMDEIRAGKFAPNSSQTLATKSSKKPLVDSGRLLDNIEWDTKVSSKVYRPDPDQNTIRKLVVKPRKSKSRKRKRKVGFKVRGSIASLAKSPGYEGKGIRARAERRTNAASGVSSRGVRRKGASKF